MELDQFNTLRRDILAATADISDILPETIGGVRDMMIHLSIIPTNRINTPIERAYNTNDYLNLKVFLKYQYADLMIRTADLSRRP